MKTLAFLFLPAIALPQLLILPFPAETDPKFDTTPVGALEISAPKQPSTRNFVAGILVTTHSTTMDKSRGIFVNNQSSKSDAFYAHNTGGGAGFAVDTGDSTHITGGGSFVTEVRDHEALGFYAQSAAIAVSPRLLWLDQRSGTWSGYPTAVITLTGHAAHIAYQVRNNAGHSDALAYQSTDSHGAVSFQVRAEDGWTHVGSLTAQTLKGTGAAYACVTAEGALFRSDAPCLDTANSVP